MKNKKTYQFSINNFNEYNLPNIRQVSNADWVNYGDNNLYPQYLIDLYTGSSMNSAIIKGVAEMIAGDGFDAIDRELYKSQWLEFQKLLMASDKHLLHKLSFDLKLFGYAPINVIWNKARTKIVQLKHLPAQTIRAGSSMGSEIDKYYYSGDWQNYRRKEYRPVCIPAFNVNDRANASQILMIQEYNPASFYYGLPDYIGSTNYIDLDRQISQLHLNNVQTGLFPSFMLNFTNGVPTEEQRREIEQQIYQKFSSPQNAGKIMITFNDGSDAVPKLEPITTNGNDNLYQYLSTEISSKILSGHRITSPLLFGVRGTGSGFGNNADELRDAYSLFNNIVIKPFQNLILDGIQEVLNVNNINLDLYIKTLKPADFIDLDAMNKVSEEEAQKEGIEMKQQNNDGVDLPEDLEDFFIEQFDGVGEQIDNDEYVCLLEDEALNEDNENKHYNFANITKGKPDELTQWGKVGLFRLLYAYSTNLTKRKGKIVSRKFCQKMVANSKKGWVYRKEDIDAMSEKGVNGQFAIRGQSKYDLFSYKGGCYCFHKWLRRWYFRRRVPVGQSVTIQGKEYKGGQYLPDGALKYFKKVAQSYVKSVGVMGIPNDTLAGTRPTDMPNRAKVTDVKKEQI